MRISDWSSDVCSSDLRQRVQPDLRTHATGRAHMAKVGKQAVGHVDAGACEPGQRKAGCDARCRAFESRTQDRIAMATSAPLFQGAGGIARCSGDPDIVADARRSEEHTSELQSLMRISYAVFCLKKKKTK